jgi:DNA-binding beta-propeller fold protein YncE
LRPPVYCQPMDAWSRRRSRDPAGRPRITLLALLVLALVGATPAGSTPKQDQTASGGDELWTSRFNGPATNSGDAPSAVVVSPDGSTVFVAGAGEFGVGIHHPGFMTIAYDAATGKARWAARYKGPGDASDTVNAIAVSPDGSRVFVTGESFSGDDSDYDYATIAYDASTGARVWLKRYNGPRHDHDLAESISVSPDGSKVFVTGQSLGDNDYDYLTVAYDASTGARLWARRYVDGEVAHSIASSADGSMVFVTGEAEGKDRTSDWGTVAYEASTGRWLWTRRYDGLGNGDGAAAIVSSPDGSTAFVTGWSFRDESGSDYLTIAYDAATGVERWARRANGPANGKDTAAAIAISSDGSKVFVTGRLDPSAGFGDAADFFTVAYGAADGVVLWARQFDSSPEQSHEEAVAIAASPDGSNVFVTGLSPGANGLNDYFTIAYDESAGTLRWARRLNGPDDGHDYAEAIAVSPDGSAVFVTGTSSNDWLTVAYGA